MGLEVEELSFQMIEAVRLLLTRIQRTDRSLADQLRRAASSVALNICEGHMSESGNRKARYFTAAGSANESLAAVRIAIGVGVHSGGGLGRSGELAAADSGGAWEAHAVTSWGGASPLRL